MPHDPHLADLMRSTVGGRPGVVEKRMFEGMDVTGRPMRGFVWVVAEDSVAVGLAGWVDLAADYVGSLPPK